MTSADSSARRWLIGSVAVGLSLASLVALWVPLDRGAADEPAIEGSSAGRASALQKQAAAGRERSETTWQTWYEALEAADVTLRVGERFLHPALADHPMVDSGWRLLAEDDPSIGPLATMVDFAAQLRRRDIDFLVLPVPPLAAVYPRSTVAGAPVGDEVPLLDWRLRELYAGLEEHGIEVIDLLPLLLDPPARSIEVSGRDAIPIGSPESIDLMFRLQDRHWTARASDLAALALADRIRRYRWFDAVTRVMGRAILVDRWFVETARGPLAKQLIRAGRLPADHPHEHVLRHVAHPVGEASTVRDRDSPILVVGDSFAGPEYGLLDSLLVELGFRVDFVTRPGGRASQQLDALRLRGDELAGKQLVIWQFTAASIGTPDVWRPVSVIPVEPAATDPP